MKWPPARLTSVGLFFYIRYNSSNAQTKGEEAADSINCHSGCYFAVWRHARWH